MDDPNDPDAGPGPTADQIIAAVEDGLGPWALTWASDDPRNTVHRLEDERIALAKAGDAVGAALVAIEELSVLYDEPLGCQEHPTQRLTDSESQRKERLLRALTMRFHQGSPY